MNELHFQRLSGHQRKAHGKCLAGHEHGYGDFKGTTQQLFYALTAIFSVKFEIKNAIQFGNQSYEYFTNALKALLSTTNIAMYRYLYRICSVIVRINLGCS